MRSAALYNFLLEANMMAGSILRRRRRIELRSDWPDGPAGAEDGPQLTPLLMRLDEKERVPLELMYFENYPLDQIAAVLGVPRGTAASRLSRGRRKLKAIIEKEGL